MKKNRDISYQPNTFEALWRGKWEEEKLYYVDNPVYRDRPPYYCLDMFPYPSGSGLHVGHWRGYVISDVWSRYKLLKGFNVLHPMGWDNFGLPAETDAIKKGIHPTISTRKNIENMRRQLKEIGCVYDWTREISTTDLGYYKWTQWIFLRMFKKGLAYQKQQPVNWCSDCRVVLANEETEGGKCERCGGPNIKKIDKRQWMLKITAYAERLLKDLDDLNWPEKVKEMQRNWIGRSEGAIVQFKVETTAKAEAIAKAETTAAMEATAKAEPTAKAETTAAMEATAEAQMAAAAQTTKKEEISFDIFTTRPDTLFGATFMVLAPEHPLVSQLTTPEKQDEVAGYIKRAQSLSYVDRQKVTREKTGAFIGSFATNPVNNKPVPIFISDYVLMDYGTGAIMSVPAHDQRDFEFAREFKLPIVEVIHSEQAERDEKGNLTSAWVGDGILINSDYLNSLPVDQAKKRVVQELLKEGKARSNVDYKLRDWIFARQRYWGEPIPIVLCKKCGSVAVPEDELPIKLPPVESYQPTGDAESPLAAISEWVNTTCPTCGGTARRETDTMPQWAGSSWYFIRYASPDYDQALASDSAIKKWLPVNMYVGGIEHAVLHLLYARFWTKFLYDEGVVPFHEPFQQLFNQGMICRTAYRCSQCNRWIFEDQIKDDFGKDELPCPICGSVLQKSQEKMSKSKGNGVNPDELVEKYGTDSLRLYELFSGDPTADSEWNDEGIKGCYTFLKKTWQFIAASDFDAEKPARKAEQLTHRLIKKVEERVNSFKLNTAVSAFMEFINEASPIRDSFSKELAEQFLITLSPFAPHIAEELWQNYLNHEESIFLATYPVYDEELAKLEEIEIAVQVNGKLRGVFAAEPGTHREVLEKAAKDLDRVREMLDGKQIRKVIIVPDKIVNFVVG